MMQKLWMVVLVGLMVAGPGKVYANSDTPTYLNAKSIWPKLNWAEFANHKIMKVIPDQTDPPPEIKNGAERSWPKGKEVWFDGTKGEESIMVDKKGGKEEFTYTVSFLSFKSESPFFCSKITNHLTKIYGRPAGTLDLSRTRKMLLSKGSDATMTLNPKDYRNAWIAGTTGIEVCCFDFVGASDVSNESALISFREKSLVKIPKPITWIECNFKGAVHTPTEVETKPDEVYTFGINDFQRKLHRRDKSSLGEAKTFSDGLIEVAIKGKTP